MSRRLDTRALDRQSHGRSEPVSSDAAPAMLGRPPGSQRHIVHVFPSFGVGGVPIRIADVISKLAPAYRHDIIALDGCYDSRYRLSSDAFAKLLEIDTTKVSFVRSVWQAARKLKQLSPDLLATYNWGSVEWALANTLAVRRPHVHFESGFGPEEAMTQLPRRVIMRRVALRGASSLVVPSRNLETIALDIWRINPRKVRYVPNGVDIDRYAAAPVEGVINGFSKAPDELIVGTVAPLRREKNIGRMIRAFADVKLDSVPVRLLIVGDGAERPGLEALARDLGVADRVVFAGHVERVEHVLGWMDVFAMSSDTEQMPNTLIQAMAAGRAVAAVDVGDIGIIVDSANYSFIVPRDDHGALVDAMMSLLKDRKSREDVGAANRRHVCATYDLGKMLSAYRAIFDGEL